MLPSPRSASTTSPGIAGAGPRGIDPSPSAVRVTGLVVRVELLVREALALHERRLPRLVIVERELVHLARGGDLALLEQDTREDQARDRLLHLGLPERRERRGRAVAPEEVR